MDLLSRSILSLQVGATSVSSWKLASPWGVNIREFDAGFCLFISKGKVYLSGERVASQWLKPGQILFSPQGANCRIQSEPGAAVVDIQNLPWSGPRIRELNRLTQPEVPVRVASQGDRIDNQMYGFAFSLEGSSDKLILPKLPELTVIDGARDGLSDTLPLLVETLNTDHEPGYFAVSSQLVQFTVTTLLRRLLLDQDARESGWARALEDKNMFDLISALHAEPDYNWSLSNMAERVFMSRSSFCRVFQKLIGDAPMTYLIDLRVDRAEKALMMSDRPIEQIAIDCGFNSSRTLRHAFEKRLNMSPSAYRKAARQKKNSKEEG